MGKVRKFDKRYCFDFGRDGQETLTLSEDEEAELKEIIKQYLEPIKTPWLSSYWLKHQLEPLMSTRYISNADCKKAMAECGYPYRNDKYPLSLNWALAVSKKSLKKLEKVNGRVFL